MTYLIGEYTRLYGQVTIGDGCLVEDNVIIGHPAPGDLRAVLTSLASCGNLTDIFDAAASRATRIGDDSIIRSGTIIYAGTSIGDRFDCGHNVIIRENVTLGNGVYVKNNTEIMKDVLVGNDCRLAGVVADNCRIGDAVSSFGVLTHTYRSYVPPRGHSEPDDRPMLEAPTLEHGSIVGRGALVIGSCVVGRDAVVAGNAIVRMNVPPGYLAVGNGRLIKR